MGSTESARSAPEAPDLAAIRRDTEMLRKEIARVLVGQDETVLELLVGVLTGGHVLLEGAPGTGKTLLVRTLAGSLGLSFARIQFTPDLMPSDVTGTFLLIEGADRRKRFTFHPGPVFGNLVLADEINRATPKTQAALLEAMQERQVTVGGTAHPLPDPFLVLATQNPIEMEGTYPLPEAQLDRFAYKVRVPVPTEEDLTRILERMTGAETPAPAAVLDAGRFRELRSGIAAIVAPEPVVEYVSRLVHRTSPHPESPESIRRSVRYGASPRGGIALLKGAKALAAMEGRPSVAFEDIRRLARPSLRHRLILSFEGEAEGVEPDGLLDDLLAQVPETGPSTERLARRTGSTRRDEP